MTASATDPYDIFSAAAQRDADLYDHMRHDDPVHAALHPQTGQTFWFLTRYDDCLSFLKDKRFGKEFRRRLPHHPAVKWIADDTEDIINQHMLNLDDPAHARLKSLVHLAFTPTRIDALRPRLQTMADGLMDVIDAEVAYGDEIDLTRRYIKQLPLLAITAMLGIPTADYPALYSWTQAMLSSDSDQARARAAIAAFSNYLQVQIDKRQHDPGTFDDLLASLMLAEDEEGHLSHDELLAMVFLLITAGYETMVNFISNSITTLLENRGQLRLLQRDIENTPTLKTTIEELLRYNGPSHRTLPSWAFVDAKLGGKLIHRGDIVQAVLFAANRDPEIFTEPNRFDILRHPNKHIAFSYGIHHCLGAALARLEGEIAIATLLRRLPTL